MPLHRLEWAPGLNTQQTQTRNRVGWFSCNLVRWRNGLLEKVAGWVRLFNIPCSGIVRSIHAYLDLLNEKNLLIGTDVGPQLFVNGILYNFTLERRIAAPISIISSSGSHTVTVTDDSHGAATGDVVTFPISLSFGTVSVVGVIIPGGSQFPITVTNANVWTFQTAAAATTSTTGVVPFFTTTISFPSMTTNVLFAGHGLNVGDTFPIQATTFNTTTKGSFTIPAGNATVTSVIDANNFSIGSYGSVSGKPSGTFTNYEGFNSNTPPTVGGPYTGENNGVIDYFQTAPTNPANWFTDNFGNFGLMNFTNGPIYYYTPPAGTVVSLLGLSNGVGAPQINAGFFTAMPQAQIVAFGSEATLNGGVQDPLLIRWCDAGNFNNWTASATNQAGSFRLGGSGSQIIGGIQAPQTSLIFTDSDIWSMLYVGPPFIYSFTTISTGCGLIAPHAVAILGRTVLWMALRGFFIFSDSGVIPVTCPVWDYIFGDLDPNNIRKIHMVSDQTANEIWVFFPSATDGTGECTRYVKVNLVENAWDFGQLPRSAGIPENAFGTPLMADPTTLLIQQHEMGYDADGLAMAGVFAQSGYADAADGEDIMLLDEFQPDMKWFGTEGAAAITLYGTNYPGQPPTVKGPFGVDNANRHIRPRLRARQIALRIDWANRLGFSARLGTPRARTKFAGKRP